PPLHPHGEPHPHGERLCSSHGHGGKKPTWVTCRSQSPVLQIVSVWRAGRPRSVPPKSVDPVIVIVPLGVLADTAICFGPAGSSLNTVIRPVDDPKWLGWKRISTSASPPGAITIGNVRTSGTRKSGDDDDIAVIVSGQCPTFTSVSGSSLKRSRHV